MEGEGIQDELTSSSEPDSYLETRSIGGLDTSACSKQSIKLGSEMSLPVQAGEGLHCLLNCQVQLWIIRVMSGIRDQRGHLANGETEARGTPVVCF